jgi:hypothetical protein
LRIPKTIKIGERIYDVKETDAVIVVDGEECSGSIEYSKTELLIKRDMSDSAKAQTLFHEIQHGICRHFRMTFKDFGEEFIVDNLASGWLMVLRDNPDLSSVFSQPKETLAPKTIPTGRIMDAPRVPVVTGDTATYKAPIVPSF